MDEPARQRNQAPDTQGPEEEEVPILAPRNNDEPGCLRRMAWGCGALLLLGLGGFFLLSTFFRPCTRSKGSQVKSDMRSMATAIEAYYMDNDSYPAWSTDPAEVPQGKRAKGIDWSQQPTFRLPNGTGLQTLTTPVAYITRLPNDTFPPSLKEPFRYCCVQSDPELQHTSTSLFMTWIMWSAGPNKQYELNLELMRELARMEPWGFSTSKLDPYTYDPSNGTYSAGDIWRVKQ